MVALRATGAVLEGKIHQSDTARTGLTSFQGDVVLLLLAWAQAPELDPATPLVEFERLRQLELQNQVSAQPIADIVNAQDRIHQLADA